MLNFNQMANNSRRWKLHELDTERLLADTLAFELRKKKISEIKNKQQVFPAPHLPLPLSRWFFFFRAMSGNVSNATDDDENSEPRI